MRTHSFTVGALLVLAAAIARLAAAEPLTASEVMKKMGEAYATASSYEDSGVVLSFHPDKPGPDELVFRTFFRRPNEFRFEFRRHHPYPPLRHITRDVVVWTDAEGRAHTTGGPSAKNDRTLAEAVAGATGVSSGASHHVPRLLTSAITGFSLLDLVDVQLVGEGEIDGVTCYRLSGRHTRGSPYELWIGKQDFVIRRIWRELLGNPVEELRRDIRINQPPGKRL